MHIGTQLMTLAGAGAEEYYTPWFPKGADNAVFTYEIIRQNFGSGGLFKIDVFTKNREDIGSNGTSKGTISTNFSGTTFYEHTVTDLKQLVRFKVTITAGSSKPAGQEGVVYRIRQRLRYVAVLTLVAGMLSSCTVVGVVISPITGPVDAVRAAVEGDIPVAKVWVVPFLVVLSPIGGLVSGIMVDEAVVAQGRWDVIPAILRPWNTIATSLPPLTAEPASK